MDPIMPDARTLRPARAVSLPDIALAVGAFLFLAAVVLGLVPYPSAADEGVAASAYSGQAGR